MNAAEFSQLLLDKIICDTCIDGVVEDENHVIIDCAIYADLINKEALLQPCLSPQSMVGLAWTHP